MIDFNLQINFQDEYFTELPKQICQKCYKSIESIIDFNRKCIERDSELREMLILSKPSVNINIKNELFEDFSEKTIKFEEILIEPKIEIDEEIDDSSIEDLKEDKTQICTICQELFPTVTKLREHRKQSHKNCPECSKSFSKYALMIHHRKRAHLNEKCPDCELVFETINLLTKHRILEHQLEESDFKQIQCHINGCGKLFQRNSNLRRHIKAVHNNIKRTHSKESCPICGKEFNFKSNIARHIESVHNKVRNYPCNLCEKSYFEKTHLANHIMVNHQDNRPFICDYLDCGKSFKILLHLTSHQKTHLDSEEKEKLRKNNLYICAYCGKTLTTKLSLDDHSRMHTNEKPFKCKICPKEFIRQIALSIHMRVHTNEKPYNCTICNQRFKQSAHLKAHSLTHEIEKKFICSVCDFSTKYKYNLDIHMRNVHINERKHQCEQCSEGFFNGKLLRKHVESKHKLDG